MVRAATAGMSPREFLDSTFAEICIVLEGYQEREKASLINRISAICRAFSKKGSPLQGLVDAPQGNAMQAINKLVGGGSQFTDAAKRWFWASEDS